MTRTTSARSGLAPDWARQLELVYVLVADADRARAAACIGAVKPFKVAVLIARDGQQAVEIIRRFGAPLLLIVDLALPRADGTSVIDAARAEGRRETEVVALPSSHELTQFTSERFARLRVHELEHAASNAALASAIDAALRRALPNRAAPPPSDAPVDEPIDRQMRELAERARAICGAAGAAVYANAPGQTRFRAFVTWSCNTAVPHSPYYAPRVFDHVMKTGEALVLPDAGHEQPWMIAGTAEDAVRGVVAVPITARAGDASTDQIVGTIAVFDVRPMTIGKTQLEALKTLGRGGLAAPATPRAAVSADASSAEPREPALGDANTDGLHPVFDRTNGEAAVEREMTRARTEGHPMSLVLFGVDPIDRLDESASQTVRTELTKTLQRTVRESDLVVDWGRRELVVVLPGLGAIESRVVAERVRAAMQVGARFQASVSAAVEAPSGQEAIASIVERTRAKVQLARDRGHNRVA